jgi:hypothetical protein
MVGYRGDDFDFHPLRSQIFPYVTIILLRLRIGDPVAPYLVDAQVIQDLEEHVKSERAFTHRTRLTATSTPTSWIMT